ncbi:MAG: hypothetical protein V4525_03865 [Pseudomonadota bacterium]
MLKKFFLLSIIPTVLTGCVTAISPKNLQAIKKENCITLTEKISWKERRGMAGLGWEEGVAEGIYKAEFEDKKGVFYRGKGRPVSSRVFNVSEPSKKTTTLIYQGGIWLPRNPLEKPRMYYYSENESFTTDNIHNSALSNQNVSAVNAGVGSGIGFAIVEAMAHVSKGDIVFLPEIKDSNFISKIINVEKCQK